MEFAFQKSRLTELSVIDCWLLLAIFFPGFECSPTAKLSLSLSLSLSLVGCAQRWATPGTEISPSRYIYAIEHELDPTAFIDAEAPPTPTHAGTAPSPLTSYGQIQFARQDRGRVRLFDVTVVEAASLLIGAGIVAGIIGSEAVSPRWCLIRLSSP